MDTRVSTVWPQSSADCPCFYEHNVSFSHVILVHGYTLNGHSLYTCVSIAFFFFSSRRRHTRSLCDWSSDVCSSDLFWFEDPPPWNFSRTIVPREGESLHDLATRIANELGIEPEEHIWEDADEQI